jgi:hypothetical protein
MMMGVEQPEEWELAGETELPGENLPKFLTLSITNPTSPDLGSNPWRRGEKPELWDDLAVKQLWFFPG